jgi:hypothetical protein
LYAVTAVLNTVCLVQVVMHGHVTLSVAALEILVLVL